MKRFTLEQKQSAYRWLALATDDNLDALITYADELTTDIDELRIMDTRRMRLKPLREIIGKEARRKWLSK